MSRTLAAIALAAPLSGPALAATAKPAATSPADPARRLDGFDAYMAKVLKDWNVAGVGVAVVAKDKVVLARGYGYRDYGQKLPFTSKTVVPIASNTKLFTATSVGLLVEEGKLAWDQPL